MSILKMVALEHLHIYSPIALSSILPRPAYLFSKFGNASSLQLLKGSIFAPVVHLSSIVIFL